MITYKYENTLNLSPGGKDFSKQILINDSEKGLSFQYIESRPDDLWYYEISVIQLSKDQFEVTIKNDEKFRYKNGSSTLKMKIISQEQLNEFVDKNGLLKFVSLYFKEITTKIIENFFY